MYKLKQTEKLVERLTQLATAHSEAVSLVREIVSAICEDLNLDPSRICSVASEALGRSAETRSLRRLPIADRNMLAILWKGNCCYLGNTLPFKLFERLVRCPNHFISHEQLLDDVWECQVTKEAIRSVVKVLKQKLCNADMVDLANAIDGSRRECYGLVLDRRQ